MPPVTLRDLQNQGSRPSSSNYASPLEGGPRGIPLWSAPAQRGLPDLSQMCCPRIALRKLTTVIAIIDLIMFIITLIVGAASYDGAFAKSNSLGGPSAITLRAMGGKYGPDILYNSEVWRLFTAIVLHAGLLHIFGNLFFFLRIGYVLEDEGI